MFDIGFAELALLMLIGLLVLGPERLPRVARTLGLYLRKARNAWGNVKQSVEAELDAEELRKALSQVKDEVKSTGESLKNTLNTEIPVLTEESIAKLAVDKKTVTDND